MGTSLVDKSLFGVSVGMLAPAVSSTAPIPGFRPIPNPSWPKIWLRFSRFDPAFGQDMTMEVQPLRFEYSPSTDQADLLEFTVADPDYRLINSPLLLEDLQTKVEFVFGYDNDPGNDAPLLSDPKKLVFFRQKPAFDESGMVTTTITCYDMGVFLAQPLAPKRYDLFTSVNDVVRALLVEVNTVYNLTGEDALTANFDDVNGTEFLYTLKGLRFHRGVRSASQFLSELRAVAREENHDEYIEIFIEGSTLYFRPARTAGYDDIGYYSYFSGVQGDHLLSFKPEVGLHMGNISMRGVDEITGRTVTTVTGNNTPAREHTALGTSVIASGTDLSKIPVGDFDTPLQVKYHYGTIMRGDVRKDVAAPEDDPTVAVTAVREYTCVEGDATLEAVAAHFDDTETYAIAAANSLDPQNYSGQLYPGRKLKIPILVETSVVSSKLAVAHSKQMYYDRERKMLTATACVIGDPVLKPGWPVYFANVGDRFSGRWYITQAVHRIDEGGYLTDLQLVKNAIPVIGQGIDTQAGQDSTALRNPQLKAPSIGASKTNSATTKKIVTPAQQKQAQSSAAAQKLAQELAQP